jgi:hypothetical protein
MIAVLLNCAPISLFDGVSNGRCETAKVFKDSSGGLRATHETPISRCKWWRAFKVASLASNTATKPAQSRNDEALAQGVRHSVAEAAPHRE